MKKYRDSLPSLTLTLIILVLCLVLGLLVNGITWNALPIAFFFAWIFLGMAFLRNFYFSTQPQFRTERDELYMALMDLTEAIDRADNAPAWLRAEGRKTRRLIEAIDARHKPKIKTK